MMTLRRLAPLLAAAEAPGRTDADVKRLAAALVQRTRERCGSKLARRLRRKPALGRAGAF